MTSQPSQPPPRAPEWARFLGDAGFQEFSGLIADYFDRRGVEFELDAEDGTLVPNIEALSKKSVFGLQNIAQKCAQAGRERWPALVSEHFDSLFDTGDNANALTVDMSVIDDVRARIRSRLYPESILKQTSAIVYRSIADGLIEVLVVDLPKSVRTVSRGEADRWPLSDDELFMIGRRNLAASGFLNDVRVPLPGSLLHMYCGDTFYGASHLLVFERYLTDAMPYGMVLSAPKRDVILAHYIHNIGVLEAINGIIQVTQGMYSEGPGSLSPHIYWYRNGGLTRLPYEETEGAFKFNPPGDFADLLQALSALAHLS